MQKKCLRTMAEAYKATPIPVLEAETIIAPIDVHLDQLQAKARYGLRAGGQARFITTECKAIANKLQGKAGRKRMQKLKPGVQEHDWANKCCHSLTLPHFLLPTHLGQTKPLRINAKRLEQLKLRSTLSPTRDDKTPHERLDAIMEGIPRSHPHTIDSPSSSAGKKSA